MFKRETFFAGLASRFPGGEVALEADFAEIAWKRDGVAVAITHSEDGLYIQMWDRSAEASMGISSPDAERLLADIFADKIVAVAAYEQDNLAHTAFAAAGDPSASFTQLDGPGSLDMPSIDFLQTRSWSGALDVPPRDKDWNIKVVSVTPTDGYKLLVAFTDGTEGVRDFADMIAEGGTMVAPLAEATFFTRVFVQNGVLAWPNGFEIDAIALHREMLDAGLLVASSVIGAP